MPSCLAWSQNNARPYLEQNNVSMMSQTSDALRSCHKYQYFHLLELEPHRGSTVGLLLFLYFSIGLVVEFSTCFISVLNLDLYDAGLIH